MHAEALPIPANLAASLRYPVSGEITAACTLTQDARDVAIVSLADPLTDTVQSTRTDLGFAVECNSRVRVRLHSQEGGLRYAAAGTSDSAFTSLVSYDAALELPGLGEVLDCNSSTMVDGGTCSTESAGLVTSGRGRVAIRTKAENRLLMAGQYTDRVIVSLTPMLGGEAPL